MENQQQQQQGNNDKIEQQFNEAWKKILAVFKGDDLLKPSKRVSNDIVAEIVDELLDERTATQREEFKAKAKKLIEANFEFLKKQKQAKEEYEKAIREQRKEMTDKMNALLKEIADVRELERAYADMIRNPDSIKLETETDESDSTQQ